MYKILVFDLDGTLCPLGKGILPENIERLHELERNGYQIVLCSGKPTYYLCGLMRQVELEHPILVGENGATFQFGVDLPPKRYYEYPYDRKAKKQIKVLKERIDEVCGEKVWYQPNEVQLTPFIRDPIAFEQIQTILDEHPDDLTELLIYRHIDCYDMIPKEINKMNGMRYLGELTGVKAEEMVSFGDGINDVPMFRGTGLSIAIGDNPELTADLRMATIGDALEYILTLDKAQQ